MLDEITTLKDRWFELYTQFPQYRDALLSTVVDWEWANGPRYDPRPCYFKRGATKGRLLRRKSLSIKNDWVWRSGYNRDGKCVLSQSDFGWFETLYTFNNEYIELTHYQTTYQLLRGVSRLYFQKSHPSHFLRFFLVGRPSEFSNDASKVWQDALNGVFNIQVEREDYVYSHQRLETIRYKNWYRGYSFEQGDRLFSSEYQLEYRTNGDLDRIIRHIPEINHTHIMYRKRQTGETLESITEQAVSKLISEIPKLIAAQKFTEPLYCLQLKYLDTPTFPPTILPGFEANRERILEAREYKNVRSELWYSLWDFDEHQGDPYPPFPIEDQDWSTPSKIE